MSQCCNHNVMSYQKYNIYEGSTTIQLSPKHDWMRIQRRHYPDEFNESHIVLSPPTNPPQRICMLKSTVTSERRHYCGLNTKSHLTNYFWSQLNTFGSVLIILFIYSFMFKISSYLYDREDINWDLIQRFYVGVVSPGIRYGALNVLLRLSFTCPTGFARGWWWLL